MKWMLVLFATIAQSHPPVVSERTTMIQQAKQSLTKGHYAQALETLQQLLQKDPHNAETMFLLGQTYKRMGNLPEALHFFQKALDLKEGKDPEILKHMATILKWMRRYHAAKDLLKEALAQKPNDREAQQDLLNLRLRRGVHFRASYGGWEVDYTKNSSTGTLFYGGLDFLDLYVGYSKTDKLLYRRTNRWIDAYLFPTYRLYIRLGYRSKIYTYPAAINPNPDLNAYREIPDYQVELSYTFQGEDYLSLEVEKFDPNFHWNPALKAHNWKLSGTFKISLLPTLYLKAYAAVLRDPDPQTLVQDTTNHKIVGFQYERPSLLGGALGWDAGPWGAEVKYLPDRDLDRSTDYSVFFRTFYKKSQWKILYDFLFDHYSQYSYRAGQTSKVHMFTFLWSPVPYLQVRTGIKALMETQGTTYTPFLLLRLRLGML